MQLSLMAVVPLDIALVQNDTPIQPSGPVEVTVGIPAGMDAANASVYHIADDGTVEKMPGRLNATADTTNAAVESSVTPTYTFTTTHFSKYAIVGPADTTASATTLTSSSAGATLNARTVYTVSASTTITGGSNRNGLVVNTTTDASNPAVLFIPKGVTLTVKGGAGTANNGGKAAILLRSGDCLYVRGAGTLKVEGGKGSVQSSNATGGGNGSAYFNDYMTFIVQGGAGGQANSGGSGGGSGIGTDGAAGGAIPTPQAGGGYRSDTYGMSGNVNGSNGINGVAGKDGGGSATAGTLYLLDTAALTGTTASGGTGGNAGGGAGSNAYQNSHFNADGAAGGGGGAGGSGTGGDGPLVGSGGAGGGSGGNGGAGSAMTVMSLTYWPYSESSRGEGGKGGAGVVNGSNGAGARGPTLGLPYYTIIGAYGGAGGSAGTSASGGTVYVASTASFTQSASSHAIHGKTATRTAYDVSKNSQYTLTFNKYRPSAASSEPSYTGSASITVTAGVKYTPAIPSPTLTGWRFTGWYTAASGGTRVIDETGNFVNNAGAYTTANGSWCYPDDATLYAHYEANIYGFTLNPMMGLSPDPAATKAVYEKYDHGWYFNAAATSPVTGITPPAWSGYLFGGYYTGANGQGDQLIGADGSILVPYSEATTVFAAADATLYAKWTPAPYTVRVTLNLDGTPWPGQTVSLYQNGVARYTFTETSTGVYEYYTSNPGDPTHGVVSGTYNLRVNGTDTSRVLTVAQANNLNTVLNYCTATVTTNLDGAPADVGAVTLRRNTAIAARAAYADPAHIAYVLYDEAPSANNTYTVYVDGENTGFTLDMANIATRSATVPFYTATVNLAYDSAWTDATVTLRQNNSVKHYLSSASDTDGDNVTAYTKILRGDTDQVSDTYQIYVNGAATFTSLQIDSAGYNSGQTAATLEYYAVSVEVNRDGDPWTNTGVELWQNDTRAYTLSYDGVTETYVYPYVMKRNPDTLDVRVTGSISGTATNLTLSQTTAMSGILDYYTVTYMDRGSIMLVQTVASGGKAARPAAPYHPGSVFTGWRTGGESNHELYDFDASVTDEVTLYAGYDAPTVVIGGYVKCGANGDVNGGGAYYRMANLAINGYARAKAAMNSATLHVTNGVVTFTNTDGYKIHNNIDTTSGDGSLTILFDDEGDAFDSITMDAAQQFLRENVIVKVKDTTARHTMQVAVYGDTV
jgi:hypothetical protein